jgi:hypothetical protein
MQPNLRTKTKHTEQRYSFLTVSGVMSAPKRTAHPSDFSEATDFIGGAIKTAREAKQAKFQDTKKTEDQPAKSLAQLLLEAEETE